MPRRICIFRAEKTRTRIQFFYVFLRFASPRKLAGSARFTHRNQIQGCAEWRWRGFLATRVGVSVTTMHSISFNPIIPNIEWECVWASKLLEKKRATRTGMVNSILWSGLTALIKLYVVCCLNKLLRKMQLRLGFFLSFRFFSVVLKGLWQPSRQTRASSGRWAACFERKRHSKVWKVVENRKGFAGSVFHLVSESKDSTRSLKVSLATGIPVQELLA